MYIFDVVLLHILHGILNNYGIRSTVHGSFKVTGNKYTMANNAKSEINEINTSVPQSSALVSNIFLFCAHDIRLFQ